MPYQLVYRTNAKLNIKAAKIWYKQQRNGLQRDFAISVKEAIARINAHPEAFTIRYKNVRIAHTKTFPFSIHFYVDKIQKQIVITNVLHDRRDVNVG